MFKSTYHNDHVKTYEVIGYSLAMAMLALLVTWCLEQIAAIYLGLG